MSTCKSCGAEIRWVKTMAGKNMPMDTEPTKGFVIVHAGDGGWKLEGDGGGYSHSEATARQVEVYTSHFATCPNADEHRKKAEVPGGSQP